MLATAKEIPSTIESLSAFLPLPLVGEAAKIAIRVLEVCQVRESSASMRILTSDNRMLLRLKRM
jgi:hypothetical protein